MRNKSEVWKFFTKKSNVCSTCNLCGRSYKTGGCTTNLISHLAHKHRNSILTTDLPIPKRIKKEDDGGERTYPPKKSFRRKKKTSDDGDDKTNSNPEIVMITADDNLMDPPSPINNDDFLNSSLDNLFTEKKNKELERSNNVTDAVIHMIAKDNMPLNCLEKEGMRHLFKTIVPWYVRPSKEAFAKQIEEKYNSIRNVVVQALANVEKLAISLVTGEKRFMILTVHYMDEKCSLNSICLGMKNLTPYPSTQDIVENVVNILNTWHCSKKSVFAITTDNEMDDNSVTNSLVLDEDSGLDVSIPCFVNLINSVISKSVINSDHVLDIIEKIRNIIQYFKGSDVAQEELNEVQRREGLGGEAALQLIDHDRQKPNSLFYCFERFKHLSSYVEKILVLSIHKEAPSMIPTDDLAVVNEAVTILRPLVEASNIISEDNSGYASLVIPLINCIKKSYESTDLQTETAIELKMDVIREIDSNLLPLEKNLILAAGTILDPRFKKIHFRSAANASRAITQIKDEVKKQLKTQNTDLKLNYNREATMSRVNNQGSIWTLHNDVVSVQLVDPKSENYGTNQVLPMELNLYLNQPVQPKDKDPIQYWTESKNAFPALSKIALKYLSAKGTAALPDRITTLLNSYDYSSTTLLTHNLVNQLLFIGSVDYSFWQN